MDIAASIQVVTEEIVLKIARTVRAELDVEYLCLAGGVALNCVSNGRLLREGIFRHLGSACLR
ncbi:MAG: carbamoyltransferase [Chitinophagales bacterium]|jgi:carbamoyltransferase